MVSRRLVMLDPLGYLKYKILAYADDIKLYASIDSESDYINFQAQLNLFIDGCQFLQLRLNPDKCFYLTYTKKREIVKDLGLTFDPQLSFIEHISDICLTSSKMLGFIYRKTIGFMNPCLIKTLYVAFIVSKLEYASIVWCEDIYPERNANYNMLMQRHGVISLARRREIHSASFAWKLVNGKLDCLDLLSSLKFSVPRIATRHMSTFDFPTPKSNILWKAPITHMSRNANKEYDDIFAIMM
ncbi:uncharacterized protein LOC135137336 [Zophobas morio]|uniref:uncharacterized protein LOC135137336 n=1 Tax=Zophobas morio TaxID=2755281 RepID=UPI003083A81B